MSQLFRIMFFAALAGLSAPIASQAASPQVFELFTSQGCSSCPPADRYAASLADDPNILVLSYHVSYWNYLGWDDPYSSPEATARQRSYAAAMRSRRVYTPQAIIQGQYDVVGSERSRSRIAMRQASKQPWVPAKLKRVNNRLQVQLPESAGARAHIWLVEYQKHTSSDVARGENAGRALQHRNSVRHIQSLGEWDGGARSYTHTLATNSDGVAVLIQKGNGYGAIIGGGWQ